MFSSLRTEVDGYLSHMLATDFILLLFNIPKMKVKVIKKKKKQPTKIILLGPTEADLWIYTGSGVSLHLLSASPQPGRIRAKPGAWHLPNLLSPLIPVSDSCPTQPAGLAWPLFFTLHYIWHFYHQGLGNWAKPLGQNWALFPRSFLQWTAYLSTGYEWVVLTAAGRGAVSWGGMGDEHAINPLSASGINLRAAQVPRQGNWNYGAR